MAKRLVCCPFIDDSEAVYLRYLYLDTLNLRVEDVTDKLAVFDENLRSVCCLDKLADYFNGRIVGPKEADLDLPFQFRELNSFEWFRSTEELRLKTGSEKLLYSCLLSYYRREYDGTQQHTFLSKPTNQSFRQGDVGHELTLETRVMVKDEEEEFVPETLDKGKTDAERDAEAALAQAQAELMQAAADAEKEEKRKEARKKRRARHQHNDGTEFFDENEAYRDFRNRDDVQSEQYSRLRQYEEEMRENNAYLTLQYDAGNYSSLPGFVAPAAFSSCLETGEKEIVHYTVGSNGLFALASRLDEFGINYTVFSAQDTEGQGRHAVCYAPGDAARAIQAIEFYELEQQLYSEGVIPANRFFNAFQLQALDYAYENYVDTSFISSGNFNGNQMIRIIEAGLQGYDMSALANSSYSTPQLDAMVHFMSHGWDTSSISNPKMTSAEIADSIIHVERSHGVSENDKFFSRNNYDSFVGYDRNYNHFDHFNDYDSAYKRNIAAGSNQIEHGAESHSIPRISENVSVDTLIHDKDPLVRREAVRMGHGLDVLVKDSDPHVRAAVAERGYGLDTLIHDKSPVVRKAVAERGYGLDTLIHDNAASVRMAVAKQGYGLDVLARDGGWNVRKVAGGLLKDQQGQQNVVPSSNKSIQTTTGNSYSWGAGYTPHGRTKSDSSFVPGSPVYQRRSPVPHNEAVTASHADRGRPQKAPPVEGIKAPFKQHALDELQVRSSFAKRAGLRLEHFGSKALDTGGRFASSSGRLVASTLVRDDETGTMSLAYRSGRNVSLVAHLVMDAPKMYSRPGKGISFTHSAVQSAKSSVQGYKGQSQVALPLRVNVWKDHIAAAEENHIHSLRKRFGDRAASLSIREINNQIGICNAELIAARNRIIPVNQKLKADLKSLPSSAVLAAEKSELIQANRKLKAEIKALQKKDSLTAAEKAILEKKIKNKLANEKAIGGKAKSIKELGPADRKSVKKAAELLKQKKLNEAILAKNGRKLKDLNKLKELQVAFQNDRKALNKILNKAYVAEGRLKSIPSMFINKFVEKLYQSGDRSLSGIGQATGYAMSFAQNPLTRLAYRSVKKIFVKSSKKTKAPSSEPKPQTPPKSTPKTSASQQRPIRRVTNPKIRAQKTDAKLVNKTKRTIGQKKVANAERAMAKSKSVANWIKETRSKIADAASKAAKSAAAAAKGILGLGSSAGGAAGGAAAGGAVVAGGPVAIILVVLIVIILIVAIFVSMTGMGSSFVLSPDDSEDNKINLSHYVDLINGYQIDLEDKISDIANGVSSVTGKEYDNVFYDYTGKNNTRQIIAMAYVRFGFDLSSHPEALEAYIEQLYKDSNLVDYTESELYSCNNGCVEREYFCYDEPDEFATTTRISLHKASDHSKSSLVGDDEDEQMGCKYKTYSCMEKGHSIYNKNGCSQHNDGEAMTSPGRCDNYTQKTVTSKGSDGKVKSTVYYYCKGHCDKKHRDYYCPGHKETVCYGDHQDLTITITSLGFDEIFNADSSLADFGSFIKGDAYEKQFTVTAYCPCTVCCGENAAGITASGTKATANRTIAVDPDVIPLGTHVWINGKEYVAEDTGGAINGYDIDMYFDSHQKALNWGVRTLTVYKSIEAVGDSDSDTSDEFGFDGWTEENIELVKSIYENMDNKTADEIYSGLDEIRVLAYGGYTGDYDFSELVFEDLDMNSLTSSQKKILDVIESNKVPTRKGYCQGWVADVYMHVTGSRDSMCCANHSGEMWGASNDWSKIQVGATVYGYSRSIYGHVGIYIGNGLVAHNIGYMLIEPLETWVTTYNGVCWGWNGSSNLTGNSAYDCKRPGTFMRGKD